MRNWITVPVFLAFVAAVGQAQAPAPLTIPPPRIRGGGVIQNKNNEKIINYSIMIKSM